ncbi:MAG: DUF2062 domain-containing protein, partial [Planctomycetota bacterium]|nr:DUF2062 domain-containing protein [Planctomycetota bacterium]
MGNRRDSVAIRQLKFTTNRVFRALGKASGTPHQIALGVAVGFFVGWLPIVGIQMAVAVIICQIVGANKVVPIFPVWLTNPATIVPIYSFNYWIGWLLTGGPPISELAAVLVRMVTPPSREPDVGFFASWWSEFRHAFGELLSMGWDMQIPLWLGCSLVGLALGDALGMPTQSFSRAQIVARWGPILTGFEPGPDDQPRAPGHPAGAVTDDT